MKANDVLDLLGITRNTLTQYVKIGKIKVNAKMENRNYDYDRNSVYILLNHRTPRLVVLYCAIPNNVNINDLKDQINQTKKYCFMHSLRHDKIVKEFRQKTLNLSETKFFSILFREIKKYRVKQLIIARREVLFGYLAEKFGKKAFFDIFEFILDTFGCEIIVLEDIIEEKKEND